MESIKTKSFFTILFMVAMFAIMTLGNVFAATEYVPVYMSVKDANGTVLKTNSTYEFSAGDVIYVTAYCEHEKALYWSQNSLWMQERGYKVNDKGMALLGYGFDITQASEFISSADPTQLAITIPNFAVGSTHTLKIQGVGAVDYLKEGDIIYEAYAGFEIDVKIPAETTITETITKVNDTTLRVTATVTNGTFSKIVYNWDGGANQEVATNPVNVTIPNFAAGSTHTLTATAYTTNGKTATKTYTITMPAALTGDVSASYNGATLGNGSTTTITAGSKVVITGSPAANFSGMSGSWQIGSNAATDFSFDGASYTMDIPGSAGQTIVLKVTGNLKDGGKTSTKTYTFKIPSPTVAPLTGSVSASGLKENVAVELPIGTSITLTGTPSENFLKITYAWDDGTPQDISGARGKITVPNFAAGSTHKLTIKGTLTDGTVVAEKIYYIKIPAEVIDDEPVVDDEPVIEEDELIIEPWMREDSTAEGLLVSLRNDTEEDKANKNFYQLDEEVIYYVDYKNCDKDIENEVKLILKLPLKFEVVQSDGGTVSKADKTITWTFPNGLEREQSGTKEVIIKYTKLSKSSYDYEIVYPYAEIYNASKKKDTSAVINYIYLDEDTEITDKHEPYMFGDEEKPTFRPDSTITRAEGALVLTRIFGINTSNVKVTDRYSDIGETYLEAQQAITAATNLGIINGYEDGTYRPKDKMTRAEFMKIIASYIEVLGEEEDVDGLEVKDGETIKVYKNTINRNHWAVPYVTLLARLNMTSVSSSEKDLRLEDEITRAEVAQLVNFYLFRAPAKVTSSTKTQFSDVSRKHKLFADIVEATRDAHTYTITDDGEEKAK